MKKDTATTLLTGLAIFAVTLAAGVWAVGRLSGGRASSAKAAVVVRDSSPRSGPVVLSDLLEKEKERLSRYPSGSLQRLLEDWTDEEVAAAFRESIKSPAGLFASEVEDSLANLLFAEWLKRDFDSALAWFEGAGLRSLKKGMVWNLSDAWPKEKSEEGLAFALANPDLFPSSSVWGLFGKIMASRAEQGPQAVEDFLRALKGVGIEPRFDLAVPMPDGFDFLKLSESPEFSRLYQTNNAAAIIRAWTAQNADEAFDWLVGNHGPAALKNLADSPDLESQNYLKWLGGKMTDLDPAQRKEFHDSMLGRWVQVPGDMRTFADGITAPEQQEEVHRLSLQMIYAGNVRGAFPFLESVEDPAERIALLEMAEPARLFTEKPYFRGYDKESETQLVKKLTEWNATPEQIRTILGRFKK